MGQPRDALTSDPAVEGDPRRQAAAAAVVAEAVALASEAAAVEAAEAVQVTAAAVTEAAGRASEAAESAKRARAEAADAAAQSVAHEAARTAARVQRHANAAAAQVQQAAWLAADELARSIADGTALDTDRMAELLAATVAAAADAAALDTTRAASAVALATDAAAAQVTQTVAAADQAAESEVLAAADAERDLATSAAMAMALETDARAVGVAEAAREAAAALLTVEQDARTVDLDAGPTAHDLSARTSLAGEEAAEAVLAAAEERDSRAETRDRVADERERVASLRYFLGDQRYEEHGQHAARLPARRAAAMDRFDSKNDRAAAASDRARLREHLSAGSTSEGAAGGPDLSDLAAELSHDLLVPLSSIIASVELLGDELIGHPDPTVATLLGSAVRAGDRMVRMLDQNMTSRTPVRPGGKPEVDLSEIARQFVAASAALIKSAGAIVDHGQLPVLRADPDEMYSVLQNLITNSIKFARPGVPPVVRLSARRSAASWRITVRDNGIGLPTSSDLDLFSLFSRGTNEVTGHGIGLATVARIVTALGGRVGAVPVARGAEIWFELPHGDAVEHQTP